MTPPADPARYKNHRFPGEVIRHGVWLYYRFPLSYRDVQEISCSSAASTSLMKPFASGVWSLGRTTLTNYLTGARSQATNGIYSAGHMT